MRLVKMMDIELSEKIKNMMQEDSTFKKELVHAEDTLTTRMGDCKT